MTLFKVTWTNFTVLKKHDIDRDKPYLWVFGIVIDGKSLVSHDYVIRKPCTSDNLGQKFGKGDSVAVPGNLDISREVSPFLGVASAGVVVVAWENAMTKDAVITKAYNDAADTINGFVGDLIVAKFKELASGTPLEDIDFKPSSAEINALRADVEAKIRATIKDGWSVFQLVHDHNVGTAQTVVNLGEPFEQCLDYRFTKGGTDYNLEGDLFYGDPAPPGPTRDPGDIPIKHQEPKPTALPWHP